MAKQLVSWVVVWMQAVTVLCFQSDLDLVNIKVRGLLEDQVKLFNTSKFKPMELKVKSDAGKLTGEEKRLYVDLHNFYRGNVTPQAANIQYMQWDDRLAVIAQQWAENCDFTHGNTEDPSIGSMGQNLYRGYSRDPGLPMRLWFEEYLLYDYYKIKCEPNKMCGHYTQVVWSSSRFVGCGIAVGCWHDYKYHVVCNYYPPGNYQGVRPFLPGKSCSQCPVENGGLCSKNLCVSESDCKKNKLDCECNLHCYNCGVLNKSSCTCKCKDGWDSLDCSKHCADVYDKCNTYSCQFFNKEYTVDKHPCKYTCGLCKGVNKDDLRNTCCDGLLCPSGSILSSKRPCVCEILCPGPKCDSSNLWPQYLLLIASIFIQLGVS